MTQHIAAFSSEIPNQGGQGPLLFSKCPLLIEGIAVPQTGECADTVRPGCHIWLQVVTIYQYFLCVI